MIGIYKIENLINHKSYIGQAIDISKRWRRHRDAYNNSTLKEYQYPIYRAIRKYGIENFSFEVLEECLREELNEKEKFYVEKYDAFFNGYNQTLGGDSSAYPDFMSKEMVIGIISDLENTNMLQREIADKWQVNISTVNGINTGRTWHHNRKYPIQDTFAYMKRQGRNYSGKRTNEWICCDCGKQISRGSTRCNNCEIKRRVRENRQTSNRPSREELKILIRSIPFTEIGRRYGVTDNSIRKWCISEGLPSKKKDINTYSDEEWSLV